MADALYYTFPFFHQRYFDNDGNPLAGGSLTFYSAGSTVLKPIYLDQSGVQAANPLPLDSTGLPIKQYFGEAGEYDIYVKDSNGVIIDKKLRIAIASTATGGTSDHKLLIEATDPVAGYLFDKIVPGPFMTVGKTAGSVGEAIEITAAPVVSATGGDVPGFLIDKISALNTPIGIESYNGKVNLTFDYTKASANLMNTPYAVWFSDSNGKLSGSSNLTYGDPNHGGNSILYSQNFLAGSNFVINGRGFNALSDGTLDLQFPTNGARVKIAVQDRVGNVYGTAFISAHNNANTASIVTDRASFSNLSDGRLVFSAKLSGEDLVYLHTTNGLFFNPTSNILTAPNLAIGSLSAAGILTNDASGNVSSVPASTFTDSQQVLVSSTDTAAGYLGTKLAAGTNIGFSVTSDSHGQKLWISARSNMLLNPTYVQTDYTVVDTDTCIVANTNSSITVTLPTPGSTYNGRAVYVYNTGTGLITISAVSGSIIGYTPGISGYGKQLFRCLLTASGSYAWVCAA